jgi:hypothetical protein
MAKQIPTADYFINKAKSEQIEELYELNAIAEQNNALHFPVIGGNRNEVHVFNPLIDIPDKVNKTYIFDNVELHYKIIFGWDTGEFWNMNTSEMLTDITPLDFKMVDVVTWRSEYENKDNVKIILMTITSSVHDSGTMVMHFIINEDKNEMICTDIQSYAWDFEIFYLQNKIEELENSNEMLYKTIESLQARIEELENK